MATGFESPSTSAAHHSAGAAHHGDPDAGGISGRGPGPSDLEVLAPSPAVAGPSGESLPDFFDAETLSVGSARSSSLPDYVSELEPSFPSTLYLEDDFSNLPPIGAPPPSVLVYQGRHVHDTLRMELGFQFVRLINCIPSSVFVDPLQVVFRELELLQDGHIARARQEAEARERSIPTPSRWRPFTTRQRQERLILSREARRQPWRHSARSRVDYSTARRDHRLSMLHRRESATLRSRERDVRESMQSLMARLALASAEGRSLRAENEALRDRLFSRRVQGNVSSLL